MSAVTTYDVKKPLRHDHKNLLPGKTVQLTEEQAAPLIEAGIIAVAEEQQDAPATISAATLGKLTKDALIALAAENSVDLPADAKKDAIVDLLLASGKLA